MGIIMPELGMDVKDKLTGPPHAWNPRLGSNPVAPGWKSGAGALWAMADVWKFDPTIAVSVTSASGERTEAILDAICTRPM